MESALAPSNAKPASTVDPRQPAGLLTVPAEVRINIYDELLSGPDLKPLELHSGLLTPDQITPPLAQISQLKDEVLPEYYKRVTCSIHKKRGARNFCIDYNLEEIGEENVRCLRKFHLKYDVYFDATLILTQSANREMLKAAANKDMVVRTGSKHVLTASPYVEGPIGS